MVARVAALMVIAAACGGPGPATAPVPEAPAVLVGAGDIAGCRSQGDEATAALLSGIPGTVFTAGDNAYQLGTPEDFAECYHPTWGWHKARTRPTPGNHDYGTAGAAGYFGYFGSRAGDMGKGYYSYDLGSWHVVALNSICDEVEGGCAAGSAQERWLRDDLQAHPARCTLAYWHNPLFSSGLHGSQDQVRPFWDALFEAGAEVVLNGNDHDYERFAPQDPRGQRDDARGIREFVIGTGGAQLRPFEDVLPNSEARNDVARGVLQLRLFEDRYEWEFVPIAGEDFMDRGEGNCH